MPDGVRLDPRHGRAAGERARRYGMSVEAEVALLIDRDLGSSEAGFDAFRAAGAPVAEALVEQARDAAYDSRVRADANGDGDRV